MPAQRNLGRALLECGRVEEARQQFEQVILAEGDTAIVRCDLGACLQELGRWGEAEKCHERALAIDPDFSGAAYNLALTRLYQRKYETAWPLYERRFESAGMRERLRRDPRSVSLFEGQRRWKGPEDRVEGGVAIWAEQGLGDQVLHSTLIPELVDAGVPFVYEVDIRMLPAYERSFGKGRFVPWNEPPNEALLQCGAALMAGSLPGWFRRNRESFMRQPQRLLAAAPGRVAHYRGRIDALGAGLKVALSWCSRRADRLGPRKSVPLTALAPLLRVPGTTFVDVQYGDTGPERNSVMAETGVRLHRLEDVDFLNDLEDVLAVIEACDLLITTSNATAHLAGALGKRTWLLVLSENPPFPYWSHDGGHRSDWYPAVEVLSRKDLETWPELVRYGARRLEALSSNSSR